MHEEVGVREDADGRSMGGGRRAPLLMRRLGDDKL